MHEKTLREKKNNFAWENLRYTNFAFNEQTTCAGNLALLTRKKIALTTKTCADGHNTCGLIIVHFERHSRLCTTDGTRFLTV
jgi:hypothetical protein